MPVPPFDLTKLPIDWTLAIQRFERDIRDDFFPDPLQYRDVLQAAKAGARHLIDDAAYTPEAAESWEVPKPNLTIRHVINVSPIDRIVYQGIVDVIAPSLDSRLSPRCRSYRLRTPAGAEMFEKSVLAHQTINTEIRQWLTGDPGARLVTIDIAQYFEHIDHVALRRELQRLLEGTPEAETALDLLFGCLGRWTPYAGRGLPQNMNPSSLLGNAYLARVDERLVSEGWLYWRYMDDIKIVAADEGMARRALLRVTECLRELGLSVNGEKTAILRPNSSKYAEFMAEQTDDIADIERIVEERDPTRFPDLAARLYQIAAAEIAAGGKSRVFRFVMGRLTSLRRSVHSSFQEPDGFSRSLIDLLEKEPAETARIMSYFAARAGAESDARSMALLLVEESACVYPWQHYHLWIQAAIDEVRDDRLIRRARRILNREDEAREPEIAGAAIYLGCVGEHTDVARVRALFDSFGTRVSVGRALCVSLQKLDAEPDGFFSELASEAGSVAVLARYLLRLKEPKYVVRPRRITLARLVDAVPEDFS